MPVTQTIYNPSLGNIPAQSFTFQMPKESEFVRQKDDPDSPIQILKGGKLYQLDTTSFLMPGESGIKESELRARATAWIQQQGVSIGEIDVGDTLVQLSKQYGWKTPQEAVGGSLSKEAFLKQDVTKATTHPGGTTLVSSTVPEKIAPEDTLAGVRSVFGPTWQPSPAFTPELQAKGIYGAVRVAGSPNVFTIGPGGGNFGKGAETPESYRALFGTDEQKGIVGEITQEQAIKLGISPATITAPPHPVITATGLAPVSPIGLPTTGVGVDNASVIVASATATQKSIQDYINLLTPPETETKTALDKMLADYMAGMTATEGRGAAQLVAEEQYGVQAKKDALTTVNNQITTKLAEFNQIQAQLQALSTEVAGKPITMASIIGSQSQIQNKLIAQKNSYAADVGLLQAQASAIQGQLTDAQNAANRAVDLKYADIETRLANQRALIDILENQWTKEEKIRADALKLYLQDQKDALNNQKQVEKDIQSVAITAISNGAPQNIVSQIQQATSVVQATQIAQPYLKEPEVEATGVIPIEEARRWGVSYGTTYEQLKGKGIVPPSIVPTPTPTPETYEQFKTRYIKEFGEKYKATPTEATIKAAWGKEEIGKDINATLYSVGLPYTIVNNKGQLTDSQLTKLQKVGIPPADAQEIMDEILAGRTLEEIRQWMKSLGVDSKVLDTFMMTLQGVKTEGEGGGGSKLDELLKKL